MQRLYVCTPHYYGSLRVLFFEFFCFCRFGVIDCYRVLEDGDRRTEGSSSSSPAATALLFASRARFLYLNPVGHTSEMRGFIYVCTIRACRTRFADSSRGQGEAVHRFRRRHCFFSLARRTDDGALLDDR